MNGRILLIEDAPDIVHLVRLVVEDELPYALLVATDGEAGLVLARNEKPDLILLDLSLPRLSGWDLLPLLRAENEALPIIVVTAHAMPYEVERARALGCTEYLSKPFELEELIALLGRYVAVP